MDIKNEVLIRVYIVLVVVVLFGILLFAQTIRINMVQGEKWRERGKSLYVERVTVEAERGNIISEDGSLMAHFTSVSLKYDLIQTLQGCLRRTSMKISTSLAHCLATYVNNAHTVGSMREFLIEERNRGAKYVMIKRKATYIEKEMMSPIFLFFNKGQYRGGFHCGIQNPRENILFKQLAFSNHRLYPTWT